MSKVSHFGWGGSVLLISLLLSYGLHKSGATHVFESLGRDYVFLKQLREPSGRVVIVAINDDDYQTLFGKRSPLDPSKLAAIIGAVARADPKVIGVDLNLETERASSLPMESVPIIWARGISPVAEGGYRWEASPTFAAMTEGFYGPPLIELSLGAARRYPRTVRVDGAERPSFIELVVERFCESSPACQLKPSDDAGHQAALIRFWSEAPGFPIIPAGALLATPEPFSAVLKDRVVLIGGSFAEARDTYMTPIGERPGVVVLASAIETSLTGGIREWEIGYLALDALIGFVVLVLTWRYKDPITDLGVYLVAGVVAVIGSFCSGSSAFIFGFVPVWIGMFVHFNLENVVHKSRESHVLELLSSTFSRLKMAVSMLRAAARL